jgi:hypothetical protein
MTNNSALSLIRMNPRRYTQLSNIIRTINHDINRAISELYRNVDYLIADFSKVNPRIFDEMLKAKDAQKIFEDIQSYVFREVGVLKAVEIDQQLSQGSQILSTNDLVFLKQGRTHTKILLKINNDLLTRFNGKNYSKYFDGCMIDAHDKAELVSIHNKMIARGGPEQFTICMIEGNSGSQDIKEFPSFCSKVVFRL